MLPKDLLEGAIKFHGHLGPFLILGLRAGLSGVDYLGKDYFEVKAKVETTLHPPHSCFIDGVQFSSGCTAGKFNLEVKASANVSVEFIRGGRRISIMVRDDVLESLDQLPNNQAEAAGREIMQKTDEELFLIKRS